MALINKHSRRRGVEVGGIRIYDTDTKFEIDEESAADFASDFSRAIFNGIHLTIMSDIHRGQVAVGEMVIGIEGEAGVAVAEDPEEIVLNVGIAENVRRR